MSSIKKKKGLFNNYPDTFTPDDDRYVSKQVAAYIKIWRFVDRAYQ